MPHLIVFVPCENVVVGQNEVSTLVGLIHEMKIGPGLPAIIPPDAALPYRWFIFAQWELTIEERARDWEQRVQIIRVADGRVYLSNVGTFERENRAIPLHRMVAQLDFLPILPAGDYRLEISIREVGTEQWLNSHDYPLVFTHVPNPVA